MSGKMWIDCPICHEPDMQMTMDEEHHTLIFCTNHGCPSNTPGYKAPDTSITAEPVAYMRDIDGTGSLHACARDDRGAIPVYA